MLVQKLRKDLKFMRSLPKLKRKTAIRTKKLNAKVDPKRLAQSHARVKKKLASLRLIHAGFGRYHKRRGAQITHYVVRSDTTGLYELLTADERRKRLAKKKKPKPVTKRTQSAPTSSIYVKTERKSTNKRSTTGKKRVKKSQKEPKTTVKRTVTVQKRQSVSDRLKQTMTNRLVKLVKTVKKRVRLL